MSHKTPKYNFRNTQNIEFEITTINAIYQKSKLELTLPHKQDFYGLFYFTTSQGKHFVDFKEYIIKKGDVFFISNEQIHYFSEIEKTNGKVILFTNSFLENDFLIEQVFEQNIGNPILSLNTQLLKDFEALFINIETVFKSTKKMKTEILKNYLKIVLIEIYQSSLEKPFIQNINYQRFIQFKRDLKKHYKIQKNVKFYAEKQSVSSKTLNISVRETIDKSAKQFINDYIILLAKRMLINTNNTSSQIAYELGFDEPTNFSKFFNRKENTSPVMFQKVHKTQ